MNWMSRATCFGAWPIGFRNRVFLRSLIDQLKFRPIPEVGRKGHMFVRRKACACMHVLFYLAASMTRHVWIQHEHQ